MPADLTTFMAAIRQFESGGNYQAQGPHTGTLGRGLGAYQIMAANWNSWSAQAGIPGADWRDPAAQDHVAAHKFREYFARYGTWELVAVAWFAGPGRANQAAQQGIESVGGLSDVIGTSVTSYVQNVMALMGEVEPVGTVINPEPDPEPYVADRYADPTGRPGSLLSAVLNSISNVWAGGQRADWRTFTSQTGLAAPATEQEPSEQATTEPDSQSDIIGTSTVGTGTPNVATHTPAVDPDNPDVNQPQ